MARQHKVIGFWEGGKTVAATRRRRAHATRHSSGWFGEWFNHTPPWWALRRSHEVKRGRH